MNVASLKTKANSALNVDIKNKIMLKKIFLTISLIACTFAASVASAGYLHNPMENPVVLRDVVPTPGNVFGFAPAKKDAQHPDSTLNHFANGDYASFESVGNYREIRIKYHEYVSDRLDELMAQNIPLSEKARAAVKIRNDARLATYLDDEGNVKPGLENGYKAALKREEKNTYEYFRQKKGLSDEEIIQSAYGSNAGMDAILGLYDRHFNAYKILIPPQVLASMNEEEKAAYDKVYARFVASSQKQRGKRGYLYFLEPELAKKMLVQLVHVYNY